MPLWIREGSCTQCGECCKLLVKQDHMLDLATGVCKYLHLIQAHPEKYICRITEGAIGDSPVLTPSEIPREDYEYWERECRPYPNPRDEAHTPPRHILPSNCGFQLRRVD